jgi:histone acetyltransferase SAS3
LVYKLATVVSFAMAEPGRLIGQHPSNAELEENDMDGEYEVDDAQSAQISQANNADGNTTDAEGSDVDAEGEEVDDDEPVGAVKIAAPADASSGEEDDSDADGDVASDLSSDAKISDGEGSEGSSSESEPENEWQGESEDGEESGAERESSNDCT